MSTTLSYQCPNCEAPLSFDAASGSFKCEYCMSVFDEPTLRRRAEEQLQAKEELLQKSAEEFCNQMEEYVCPNCGAEVIADEHTVATHCCYCHTPVIHRGKLSGQLQPSRIIPFKYSREQAEEMFLSFARKHKFVPRGFFAKGQLEKLQGIYYPFWITDADANVSLTATATRVRTWTLGQYLHTETSRFRVERGGEIHFEDITTSAFSEADKKMLEGILPYPSEALEPFTMPYLSGFLSKKRNLEREQLQDEVNDRISNYARDILRETIHDYNTVTINEVGGKAYRENWEYALMPIYILVWRGKKRNYTYAMNGCTGKIYGELPVSTGKLWALGGGVAAAATIAATILGLLGGLAL